MEYTKKSNFYCTEHIHVVPVSHIFQCSLDVGLYFPNKFSPVFVFETKSQSNILKEIVLFHNTRSKDSQPSGVRFVRKSSRNA